MTTRSTAGEHIRAFQANPCTRIVAISSRRPERVERRVAETGLRDVGTYTDLGKALQHPGVDIVSVCTPQHLHAENVIRAARAGKHIVIEKPIANSLPEMELMRDAVRRSGVKTVVSFVLRWNPLRMQTARPVDEGPQGPVRRPNRSLADFVAPRGVKPDYVGLFAVTARLGVEKHEARFLDRLFGQERLKRYRAKCGNQEAREHSRPEHDQALP